MEDHLAVVKNEETGLYHGAFYRNKPTPSGFDRPILMATTTQGFDNIEDAACCIEKAMPHLEKIPRDKTFKPEDKLMALSWRQPYAEMMLHGKIETRTWATKYRGWVLICAGKQAYHTEQMRSISGGIQLLRMYNDFLSKDNPKYEGHAMAIGYLSDCRPMQKEDEDKCFVEYHADLFCHIYTDVRAIQPIPWKGKQGWKEVSDEIKNQLILLP